MTRPEEVKAFAREFINGKRTREQRTKIREALFQLTGERVRITCETCYVEAIYKILKLMERKPCKYRLLKGAVLQPFGEGIVTNESLTDELAEKCLRTIRGAASLFAVMPADAPQYIDPNAPKIVPVEKENKEVKIDATDDLAKKSEAEPAKKVPWNKGKKMKK